MKRILISAVLLLMALGHGHAAKKLNVLLIISDDLRDALSCYGNTAVKSPNIDRLAKRGVLFERAYAQYPVCNPSRSSFLTGLRPEKTGVTDNVTMLRSKLPDVVTLPQLLRQNGWRTSSFGKTFHVGERQGEVRDGWSDLGTSWDEAEMFHVMPAGRVVDGRNLTAGKLKWCEWGATGGSDDDQPDGQVAQHAIRAIEKNAADGKPWLVSAGFHRPHDPFLVPTKYIDMYPTASLRLYRDPADISPERPLSILGGGFAEAFDVFTDEERLEFLRAYYAGVTFMDAQVGRLLDTLDRMKLWDSTVVIFMSDHGYHLNERNWWNKNTLFERTCRVPFIVAAPDGKSGETCRSLIELVDLYPTVTDYCGISSATQELAGRSLRPLVKDPDAKGKTEAYTLVVRGGGRYGQAVRTDRWRYIRWSDGNAELYDHANDPEEVHDVSGDPKHAALVGELNQLLEKTVPYRPKSGKAVLPKESEKGTTAPQSSRVAPRLDRQSGFGSDSPMNLAVDRSAAVLSRSDRTTLSARHTNSRDDCVTQLMPRKVV